MHISNPILVLGGTGKTGHRIVERLQAQGFPVRIGSRHNQPAFDWYDPTTWPAVLNGVEVVYISFQPDLAIPEAFDSIHSFVEKAVQAGVRRLVILSGRGEEAAERCEQIVMNAGVEWTVLRASWFHQNFSESFFLEGIQQGQLVLPVADVREPFIDAEDIAEIAVAALTQPQHTGRVYELTGPRLLTFAEAVQTIARYADRPIRYDSIPLPLYLSALEDLGTPPEMVALLAYLFSEVLDGRNASLTTDVERVLGRPAIDFDHYAQRTAALGVWAKPLTV
ncbi:NmrA family transcriptional regulator [Siphonobacter sp. BAB-5385]|uniref:SDR family oxidoreductase n=1 Tax=Siphonobacter sp. BAB-5385 TaxID=1864822 RepID=UPI000B9E1E29|nr:NAD(P)H-binding protein [Siphonobacter sp. BAB-5385]OZI07322.1 NmrA family transcriptional regulator [Siphonobacter sp. BAB-5385]